MFSRILKKQNKLKRTILKLLNVYAYDKETLNIVNPNFNNVKGNLIDFNNKSFNFSRGYLELTRKIKNIDIFFRYSPNNNLWNSTDRWKRIVPDIDKKTLISVCLISLKDSILYFLNEHKVDLSFHLVSDNSSNDFDNLLLTILDDKKIKIFNHKSKIRGNRGSFLECCDQAEVSKDLIFFIEDDYLFEIECIDEMILTFSRLSSMLKTDVMMCPCDYPFYYDSLYKTVLHLGKRNRWRNVEETLLTLMFSKKIFHNYKSNIRKIGETINTPFELPLHEIYKKEICVAPISTLAHHISRSVPSINEDWQKTWDLNYQKFKKNYS